MNRQKIRGLVYALSNSHDAGIDLNTLTQVELNELFDEVQRTRFAHYGALRRLDRACHEIERKLKGSMPYVDNEGG